jgi:starch synthase
LPLALTEKGWQATVVTPSYDAFHKLDGAQAIASVDVWFRGREHVVDVYDVPGNNGDVRNIVFEHPFFSPQGPGRIYCSDAAHEPFATDASKFAFFSAALATWLLGRDETPDALHLHDWHLGFYFILREFDERFAALRKVKTVFTIHNLAYQGIRPFDGHESSLAAWFPGLNGDFSRIRDPRYHDCLNPMAAAIRLADRVSTVSPTYAREICLPSHPGHGFIGGEGLEQDLQAITIVGKLVGITNGCEYLGKTGRKPAWARVVAMMREQVDAWRQQGNDTAIHELAAERLLALPKKRPAHVIVSIGRLVDQKVRLLLEPMTDGRATLEHLLEDLGPNDLVILLGSGDSHYEQRMFEVAQHSPNLIFLRGYSEQLADPLYRSGDLFLMPSSFEPCGISQMLSMRVGVPCVVHGVGGLRDTVDNDVNGFVFDGTSRAEQTTGFIATVRKALALKDNDPAAWKKVRAAARAARFDWDRSAQQTIDELYSD